MAWRYGQQLRFLAIAVAITVCALNVLDSRRSISSFQPNLIPNTVINATTFAPPNSNQSSTNNTEKPQRVNWRYDEAGFPDVVLSRSHWLPSIPKTRSIPIDQAENLTYHQIQRKNVTGPSLKVVPNTKGRYRIKHPNYNVAKDHRTLYIYNPSIAPLIGKGLQDAFNDKSIAYVATFRLYLGSNCFGPNPERVLMKGGDQINYLGVALLNATLDILYDAVIDVNAGPLPDKVAYWNAFKQPAEDCRVFIVKGSISMICNALSFKVRLEVKGTTANSNATDVFPYVYDNLYGEKLVVVLLEPPKLLVNAKAKNMNVFQHHRPATNNQSSQDEAYLQVYPFPHLYKTLEGADEATQAPGHRLRSSFDTPDMKHTIRASPKELGRGASTEISELPFLSDDEDRGTACCVDITLSSNQTVMVGISHIKLHRRKNYWTHDQLHRYDNATYRYGWNRYLSRFLAYDSEPPFAVVAKSGWFCLGFGGTDDNSLAGRNTQYALDLFDDVFDCPAIHFPSGISETVDDPTKAIISYGVNDCYPRIVVVYKEDIRKRFEPISR